MSDPHVRRASLPAVRSRPAVPTQGATMTSPQDKYAEAMRTSQAAVVEAFESWTKSAQSAISTVPGVSVPQVEPQQVIDQVFDFAEKLLEVQREFAKSLASTAAAARNPLGSRPNRSWARYRSMPKPPPRWSRTRHKPRWTPPSNRYSPASSSAARSRFFLRIRWHRGIFARNIRSSAVAPASGCRAMSALDGRIQPSTRYLRDRPVERHRFRLWIRLRQHAGRRPPAGQSPEEAT